MLLILLMLTEERSVGNESTPWSVEIRFLNPEAALPALVNEIRTTSAGPEWPSFLRPQIAPNQHISLGFAATFVPACSTGMVTYVLS